MKLAKTLKIIFFSLLFLAVVAYVIYTFFGMESTNPEEECAEVAVIIDEEDHDAFVDSTAVMQMLNEAEINPVGRKMKFVDLDEIKRVVEKNPFVTSAECYSNNNGMEVGKARVCVKVHQLVPVALVYDRHDVSYYVDASGNIIETDSLFARNILVANGEINRNFVVSDLAAFANYIHSDDFWDNQIEQVYVEYDKNKERVVTLIPRVGEQRIYLGPITDYDKKLKRLRKFYEQGMSVVGWNKYSVLNLEYDNQVVGIIKGMEIKKAQVDDAAEPATASEKTENKDETTEKKDETKKDEQKKDEAKKDDAKKEEQKKEEVKKEEPKKDETKKDEAKKNEPQKEQVKKDEKKKEEPKKEEKKAETKKKDEPKKEDKKK